MIRTMFLLAGGAWLATVPAAAQPGAGLTMTCHPTYKGNDLGPQVYRIEGVQLIKTDPSKSEPIILSSAVKRQALDRTIDKGVVTYSAASHRIRGQVLTRTVFWTNEAGQVTRSFKEVYDFRAKTIRGLTGAVERCK